MKRAAIFDLDLTITDKDSFRVFLREYYFAAPRRWIWIPVVFGGGLLRKVRLISLARFKGLALIGLRGHSPERIREVGGNVFRSALRNLIRPEAAKRIDEHKKKGESVFIISASPDVYVHAFAQLLGCDGYMCSSLEFDKGGFTGRILGNDCIGEEKRRRLMELAQISGLDLESSCAYSDHEADLPLLRCVGKAVAVTPTRALRKIAEQNGWTVASWG